MKKVISLFIVIFSFTFLIVITLYAIAFFKVRSLTEIPDPDQFIVAFNPAEHKPVKLRKCTDPHNFMYGRCLRSEYFPYNILTIRNVLKDEGVHIVTTNGVEKNLTKPSAWILSDSFWNIFYVDYADATHNSEFFGPFKIKN